METTLLTGLPTIRVHLKYSSLSLYMHDWNGI